MTEQSLTSASSFSPNVPVRGSRRRSTTEKLAKRLGLVLVSPDDLIWMRRARGKAFTYLKADGAPIRSRTIIARLASLAVPPAYVDVRYAADPKAHLQAVGRDAAGRLQYRYHSDWQRVRETRKARRLARLIDALPKIRRQTARILAARAATREFALATVIELVARTALRPGSETYARMHGTRGAVTLLKSNVSIDGDTIAFSFRGKGGKMIHKETSAARLVRAIKILSKVPGRRLFQFRNEAGEVRAVTTLQVNAFLRDIAGTRISMKDLRTLLASAAVMESLARMRPAKSERARRKQVLEAVRDVADELANTPAICRKSYVHETVVTAFENGMLERFSSTLKSCRSPARREEVLAQVVAAAGPTAN